MPSAAAMRLRAALEEYVRSVGGDTGTRRGGIHRQIASEHRELYELANGLLTKIGGGSEATTPTERNTPGSRARDRASTGGGFEAARDSARALLGGGATNRPAGTPAGNEGGTP